MVAQARGRRVLRVWVDASGWAGTCELVEAFDDDRDRLDFLVAGAVAGIALGYPWDVAFGDDPKGERPGTDRTQLNALLRTVARAQRVRGGPPSQEQLEQLELQASVQRVRDTLSRYFREHTLITDHLARGSGLTGAQIGALCPALAC